MHHFKHQCWQLICSIGFVGFAAGTFAQETTPPAVVALSTSDQPESRLSSALIRQAEGKALQPFRVKVGEREYDFAQALKLKPADTDGKEVKILAPFAFQHPALLNNLKELAFIKKKIAAGEQPWTDEFAKMQKSGDAALDYPEKMKVPPVVISCDFSGRNDNGSIQEMRDANAAYTQALMWYFTDNDEYAKNTAKILETYAKTVTSHEGKNWYLEVAWAGSVFPLSAELLKATYPEWKNSRLVAQWFNDVFLPPLHNRTAHGNREFATLNAIVAIGVFNEDLAALYEALNHWMNYLPAYHYLAEDGPVPYLPDYWIPSITPSDEFLLKLNEATFPKDWTSWITLAAENWNVNKRRGKFGDDGTGLRKAAQENKDPAVVWSEAPKTYLSGYTAETARDLAHVGVSFASEINTAEIAWHQGVDVYTPTAKRLTVFMETHLSLRLGQKPPAPLTLEPSWDAMKKLVAGEKLEPSTTVRLIPYGLVSTWEIGYNHYANRAGMKLPNTRKIINILRQTGPNGIRLPKGTPPNQDGLWVYPDPIPPLFATNIGESSGWVSSWETLTHGELDAEDLINH
jgi:hypothetical protein